MSNLQEIMQAVKNFVGSGNDEGNLGDGGGSHGVASDLGASSAIESNTSQAHPANSHATSQGINNGHDKIHSDVYPYVLMTWTCYMEFDPRNLRGKLPAILARCVNPRIGHSIILQYINRNQIQARVQRKNAKFYGLTLGGWITILYITPLIFHIKITEISGAEVTYPHKNPPCRLMLPRSIGEGSSNGPISQFIAPTKFAHILQKSLTSSDIETGSLLLLWRGFCQYALPNQETHLTIIDWLGYTWKNCPFHFENSPEMQCKISGQWKDICKVHRLAEGITVKFGATQPANNIVLYLKIYPFIGVRTTFLAPTIAGEKKAFYQSDRYFML